MSGRQWPQELQQYTRELLDKKTFGMNAVTSEVCLKHIGRQYGFIEGRNAIDGRYIVKVRGSGQTITFLDSASLIQAGWALD
ncbi:MAG: hypothetical protein ACYDEV_10040 [Acidiferrobacter sp.]